MLLASYEAAAGCVWELATEACAEKEIGWASRVGVAVGSILRFLAVEPGTAAILSAQAPAGERQIAVAQRELVGRLAGLLATGREPGGATLGAPDGSDPRPPDGAERRLIAGTLALVSDRVAAGETERLPELGPQITTLLCAPYM